MGHLTVTHDHPFMLVKNMFGVIKRKYRSLCKKLMSPQSAQQCKEMFEGVLGKIGLLHPYFRKDNIDWMV